MATIMVLYYSSYGHLAQMADAVASGAREAGARVDVRSVPETAPPDVVEKAGFRTDCTHPVIECIDGLADYDAVIVGSPTRFGRMASQMTAFLDQGVGSGRRGR